MKSKVKIIEKKGWGSGVIWRGIELTEADLRFLKLLALGYPNTVISKNLGVTKWGITRRSSILRNKLFLKTRSELMAALIKDNFLQHATALKTTRTKKNVRKKSEPKK